jgi:deoxyribonuclease V
VCHARNTAHGVCLLRFRQLVVAQSLMPERHFTMGRLPPIPDLPECLGRLLAQVPRGRATTYGDLADALGDRIAARWVGHFAMHHEHDARCACHRVVRADGQLGGYVDGPAAKRRRLEAEGVAVAGGAVRLAECGFRDFVSERPLAELRRAQESLVERASLAPPRKATKLVGGVDVSYAASGEGVAAYVLVELDTGETLWHATLRRPVLFPYISSYLSFRELPLLLELMELVRAEGRGCDVLMVDGTGRLHPRHAGIATHLGVVARQPTIGVTKKLLCGRVDVHRMRPMESRPVLLEGHPIGAALRPTSGSRRPIYVSPGHRVDLALAEALVRRLLTGRRLPEPLYQADRLSRAEARGAQRGGRDA